MKNKYPIFALLLAAISFFVSGITMYRNPNNESLFQWLMILSVIIYVIAVRAITKQPRRKE